VSKILIVEDEPDMILGLKDNFEFEGYEVVTASDGAAGLERARTEKPDLIVLDIMLPKLSGLEVCKTLRGEGFSAPIIMLTARGQEIDKVVGLELGADDYVTKPFSLRELLARVRAVLRRPGPRQKPAEYAFGDVRVRVRGRQVFQGGRELRLTRKEFDLLAYLLHRRGEVATREELLDEVWGYERYPTTRTVDTHILRLRRKFEADPERPAWILTVHGQGYKFAASCDS
jgi:two-component system alkaline phosphatase synthesis response regulator PhoP